MFAIRTDLSKKIERLFSFIYKKTPFLIQTIFDTQPLINHDRFEAWAAFVVSPNRSLGDFLRSIPLSLFLGTGNIFITLLCVAIFALSAAFSPFICMGIALRGGMTLDRAFSIIFYMLRNMMLGAVAGLLTSVCLFLSPISRLIATGFWLCDPNGLSAEGETLLTKALKAGINDETLKTYIDNLRIKTHAVNLRGETPLTIAIKKERTAVVRMLLAIKHRPDQDPLPVIYEGQGVVARPTTEEPFEVALVSEGQYKRVTMDIIHLLLDNDVDPSIFVTVLDNNIRSTVQLIPLVVEKNDIEVLMAIASKHKNCPEYTEALPIAVGRGDLKIASLLMDSGAKTSALSLEQHVWPLADRHSKESMTLIHLVSTRTETRYGLMDRLVKNNNPFVDDYFGQWCQIDYKEAWAWAIHHVDKDRVRFLKSHYPVSLSDRLPLPKYLYCDRRPTFSGEVFTNCINLTPDHVHTTNDPSVLDYLLGYPLIAPNPIKLIQNRKDLLGWLGTGISREMKTLLIDYINEQGSNIYRAHSTHVEFILFLVKNGVETNHLDFPIRLIGYVKALPLERTRIMGEGLAVCPPKDQHYDDVNRTRVAWVTAFKYVQNWERPKYIKDVLCSYLPDALHSFIIDYDDKESTLLNRKVDDEELTVLKQDVLFYAATLANKETEMNLLRMSMRVFSLPDDNPVAKRYSELQSFFQTPKTVLPSSGLSVQPSATYR